MAGPLEDLWGELEAAVREGAGRTAQGDLETARECARIVLSVGSKLHARLGILVDFRSDAKWRGEVDRALARRRPGPAELPGQQSIADAPAEPPARGKRPRKGE